MVKIDSLRKNNSSRLNQILNESKDFKSYAEILDEISNEIKIKIQDKIESGDTINKKADYWRSKIDSLIQTKSILVIFENEGLQSNVGAEFLVSFINEDKIVMVGNKLYQFNLDNTKIILDGDYNKVEILDEITSTDFNKGIEVIQYNSFASNKEQARVNATWQSRTDTKGTNRLIVYEKFDMLNCYSFYYYLHIRTLKSVLGIWFDNNNAGQVICNGWYEQIGFARTNYSGVANYSFNKSNQEFSIALFATNSCQTSSYNPIKTNMTSFQVTGGPGGTNIFK